MEMLKLHDEEAHRLPRLIFGFRNEPENPIMKMIELMKPAGEFHLSPLSDRPEDISPLNTIPSSLVADARISYGGTGIIEEANTPGWLTRFFTSPLNPF